MASATRKPKAYKGVGMEGPIARWYASTTRGSMKEFESLAASLVSRLEPGAMVLEIAPGPGYLAIEIARRGRFRVTGVDISRSFVRIARENAQKAGVEIEFRHGNASALPFAADWFDLIVCRAAFKNFADPVGAIREMYRVLRPGGEALIVDMRGDATNQSIAEEVATMKVGAFTAMVIRSTLRSLRKRAYTRQEFEQMVAQTPFGRAQIDVQPLGFGITLSKPRAALAPPEREQQAAAA